ncbi:hypothetical protein F5B18DRAFT_589456 [Nemania serpens]|nr:hypothetical protein F5B18DRAFT_589456 [Nemania serpens]
MGHSGYFTLPSPRSHPTCLQPRPSSSSTSFHSAARSSRGLILHLCHVKLQSCHCSYGSRTTNDRIADRHSNILHLDRAARLSCRPSYMLNHSPCLPKQSPTMPRWPLQARYLASTPIIFRKSFSKSAHVLGTSYGSRLMKLDCLRTWTWSIVCLTTLAILPAIARPGSLKAYQPVSRGNPGFSLSHAGPRWFRHLPDWARGCETNRSSFRTYVEEHSGVRQTLRSGQSVPLGRVF